MFVPRSKFLRFFLSYTFRPNVRKFAFAHIPSNFPDLKFTGIEKLKLAVIFVSGPYEEDFLVYLYWAVLNVTLREFAAYSNK